MPEAIDPFPAPSTKGKEKEEEKKLSSRCPKRGRCKVVFACLPRAQEFMVVFNIIKPCINVGCKNVHAAEKPIISHF
jgi:hypothetical protein